MHKLLLSTSVAVLALAGAAKADDLQTLQKDPKQWVMPTGDYANTRYSALKQITTENVDKLRRRGRSRPACCAAMKARRS